MSRNIIHRGNLSLISPEGLSDWIRLPQTLRVTPSCKTSLRAIADGFGIRIPAAVQTVLTRSATTVARELNLVACNDVTICDEDFIRVGLSKDTRRLLDEEARRTPGSCVEFEASQLITSGLRQRLLERDLMEDRLRREREEGRERA
jgi:hypothetical protein